MNRGDENVVQPLPGIPRPALHGVGEGISASDRVRLQDLLSVADMPARPAIFQQTRRQHSVGQGNEKNDEDEICNRGG